MYPSEKELLDISTRKNLKIDDLVGLVSQIECQLDDQILLQKLRQLRNTFATGGRELFDGANNFDYNLIDEKLFPLFDEFLFGNQWKSGVVLVLQIYSNLVEKHNINLLARFDENLTVSAIENFEKINDGVSNYLAAYIFISQKPKKYLLFDAKVYTIYLWYFLRSSSATEKDGWHILLFNHLFQYFPSVYTEMIEMKSVEQFPDQFIGLLELFTAKLKEVRIEDDMNEISVFNVDIIHKLKELFFDLCNGLLLAGKNNELPFGARSELLFELLSFLSICSARMKTVLSTEAMIVAICGILKRCWEISQERAKELQPKLTKDGNLPKKSEYIELMFSVWKDAVRILANILDDPDKKEKRVKQDLVRSLGAIPAVLAASGTLHINQIRNWAIQTISQLTENNIQNQQEINEMEKISSVDNHDVSVDRVDGKFHFKRIK